MSDKDEFTLWYLGGYFVGVVTCVLFVILAAVPANDGVKSVGSIFFWATLILIANAIGYWIFIED